MVLFAVVHVDEVLDDVVLGLVGSLGHVHPIEQLLDSLEVSLIVELSFDLLGLIVEHLLELLLLLVHQLLLLMFLLQLDVVLRQVQHLVHVLHHALYVGLVLQVYSIGVLLLGCRGVLCVDPHVLVHLASVAEAPLVVESLDLEVGL